MRSIFGPVINKTPVNLNPRSRGGIFGVPMRNDTDAQLAATGSVGTLFAIVDALMTGVSAVDWRLYRRGRTGKEEDRIEVTSHAAIDLLNKPNPFYTRAELIESVQQPIDLVGEGVLLATRIGGAGSLPMELWPVRPDRVEPIPHPTDFIECWNYRGPDGERIRIENADLGRIKLPNPRDPFRGMGPVQGLLADIDSARYSAEWNRNFFINGAEPGGIIEVPDGLSDDDFDTMSRRWREQHQGVANAHRVAIIEHGKWVDRQMSMKDMQFAEMRAVPRELIREAFRFSEFMLGMLENANRASANAALAMHAQNLLVPRLNRWKQLLNTWLLPMYSGGDKLEFDYDNPVPPDAEALDRERTSKTEAAVKLITTGFDPVEVLAALDLPEITFIRATAPEPTPEPDPVQEPVVPDEDTEEPPEDADEELPALAKAIRARRILAAAQDELEAVQRQWENALDTLLLSYGAVTAAQRAILLREIRTRVDEGDLAGLATLTVDSAQGAAILEEAMVALSTRAAVQVAREAAGQGVKVEPVAGEDFAAAASAAAALLAMGLAGSAGREALRHATPGRTGAQVANEVATFLESLTDRAERDQLGGALTAAQNQGRIATLAAAPDATYVATEALDSNTCAECRRIDGTEFATLDDARAVYANGGYTKCAGRERCRGTVVAEWTEEQA